MEDALLEIIAMIKGGDRPLDATWLDKLVRRHNRLSHDRERAVAKRRLLPYYLSVRENDPERWKSWGVDAKAEEQLLRLLKMKPRRTASGVATITVITKPWPCSGNCLFCPNDVRMPKSYLANEPACQRAEHNYFDPYLQVKSRLHVLGQMGHVTDKVELIVLGGTWSDYPEDYQRWFVRELFRALNDGEPYVGGPEMSADAGATCSGGAVAERAAFYTRCGIRRDSEALRLGSARLQRDVSEGSLTYNQAIHDLMSDSAWRTAEGIQHASWEEVEEQQRANEGARHRVVGLVIETRPDLITPDSARDMRRLGCTKIQVGVQSLDDKVLLANGRGITSERIARAFAVLRLYGFKIHAHFMVNLLGSTPVADKADYLRLVGDPRFCPDEVKLYPCALVESSRLMVAYAGGDWCPYTEDELLDVLVEDVLATPGYVRISRMIRDISSTDIVAGNKKTNLRQMVEARLEDKAGDISEIRMREIATDDVRREDLRLECLRYRTTVADECFLQWVTEEGRIAGFCRLSLPDVGAAARVLGEGESPTLPGTAMIREVHVYGRVAGFGSREQGAAQHAGFGKALVAEACRIAGDAGYGKVAVISSVGTRGYYRSLGFEDADLYQLRDL